MHLLGFQEAHPALAHRTRSGRMPSDHSIGLHEVHRVAPVREHPLHQDPEHAIAVVDLRALHRPLQNGELVTQSDVLEREPLAVLDQCANESK